MIPAWSHSRLESFVSCPRKFHGEYIEKRDKGPPSEAQLYGLAVHKAFEDHMASAVALPDHLRRHQPFLDTLKVGTWQTESKVAITRELKSCTYFDPGVWWRGIIDYQSDLGNGACRIVDFKGLPLDTLISTPNGFTTMGAVQVGDMVHASDGLAYPVLIKSPVSVKPCFEVLFDDRTRVICDHEHLWKLTDGSVTGVQALTTKSLIEVAAPCYMPERDLPIDPYVLGLWLADGKHTSGEVCKPDMEIWEEVQRRGYVLGKNLGYKDRCRTHTICGIRGHLTALGLMRSKHIPEVYLLASIRQRIDLARGLMDGDGYANPLRKQVVFSNINKRLSDDVKSLLESLGQRVSQARAKYSGFGVEGIFYPVSWKPQHFNPFLLTRKASVVLPSWGRGYAWRRRVLSVTPVIARETACIGVGSPDNTYLCGPSRVVTHNTGKPHTKVEQLYEGAVYAFIQGFETCEVMFYWTQTLSCAPRVTLHRDRMMPILRGLMPHLQDYAQAFKTDIWQPKRNGLCKGWCIVKDCEFWQPGKPQGF